MVNKEMICPICGELNDDNWPVRVHDHIMDGGCQECWEKENDKSWMEAVKKLSEIIEKEAMKKLSEIIEKEEIS